MPVRSGVCTYSPLAASNTTRYSSASTSSSSSSNYTPSSLSIGHYKPLSTTTLISSRYNPSPSSSADHHQHNRYSTTSSPYLTSSSSSSSSSSTASSSSSLYSSSSLSSPHHQRYPQHHHSSTLSSSIGGHYKPLSSPSLSTTTTNHQVAPRGISTRYSSNYNSGSNSNYEQHPPITHHHRYSSSSGASISSVSSTSSSQSYRRPSILSRKLSTDKLNSTIAGLPCGLVNLGNTCYINAVLQALYSVEKFRKLILRSHGLSLTNELSNLFKQMQTSTCAVSPANFKYAFSRYQSRFSGLGQQDAQEFLRYLINGVHEELNEASTRPRRYTPLKAPENADEAWAQYKQVLDDSPLVNLAVGQLCSMITCGTCQNKSNCWDPFWDLSLPLMRGRHSCKLSDVIEDFCAKEVLDYDERPSCSKCGKATKSTKQISIHRSPQLLILHLKKFSNDGYKLTSPDVKIDRQLNLNSVTYSLSACISHHGHSSSSGHYTSHCRYSTNWFHFNDNSVRDVTSSFNEAKLDDAYVLFYEQQSSPSDYSKL